LIEEIRLKSDEFRLKAETTEAKKIPPKGARFRLKAEATESEKDSA